MQFSTVDGLPKAWQGTEDPFSCVSVVTDSTPSMVRVTAVAAGAIRPDSSDPCTVYQRRFKSADRRNPRRREQAM
eukprot:4808609-Amphidinium_carterae.1